MVDTAALIKGVTEPVAVKPAVDFLQVDGLDAWFRMLAGFALDSKRVEQERKVTQQHKLSTTECK